MKYYRYKQVQRLTFFGNNDILKLDNNSLSKTSEQTTDVNLYDTKRLRFDVNKISSVQLSNNARIVLESVYLPINSNIKTINLTNGGTGYTSPPTVTFIGKNRTIASATCTIAGPISNNFTIVSGGSGYIQQTTTVSITGGGGTGATATPVITNGVITGVTLTNAGSNYSSAPTITIDPGGSSIQSIFLSSAGTNYTTAATIEITGGGGTGASAELVFVQAMGTIISGVNILNAGYGYTSIPTVTIIANGTGSGAVVGSVNFKPIGSGANIQSILNGSVNSVTFIDDGSGYTDQPPQVEFSGGGGTGAAANTTLYTDNLDRKGPVTLRMNNLNGNSYDSQNKGYNTTLVYTTNETGTTFQNTSENMLYNFAIDQHFFKNGYIDLQITYPGTNFILPSFETFYISFVVYDVNEEELLLKDTPEVDFKNYGAHYNLNNGRIPK
jgi:hypothetical protein